VARVRDHITGNYPDIAGQYGGELTAVVLSVLNADYITFGIVGDVGQEAGVAPVAPEDRARLLRRAVAELYVTRGHAVAGRGQEVSLRGPDGRDVLVPVAEMLGEYRSQRTGLGAADRRRLARAGVRAPAQTARRKRRLAGADPSRAASGPGAPKEGQRSAAPPPPEGVGGEAPDPAAMDWEAPDPAAMGGEDLDLAGVDWGGFDRRTWTGRTVAREARARRVTRRTLAGRTLAGRAPGLAGDLAGVRRRGWRSWGCGRWMRRGRMIPRWMP